MKKDIIFEDSLVFEVYVIGYKEKGESIVLLLKADRKPVFAGLVDCYQDDVQNEALYILRNSGREYFDFVCWTHPHEDHTIGLDSVLSNYCSDETSFWMPMGIEISDLPVSKYSREVKKTYQKLYEIITSRKRKKLHVNQAANRMRLECFKCRKTNGISNYEFAIHSFAPSGEIITQNEVKDIFTASNDFSIGLLITIGEFGILLASDVENRTFDIIPEMDLEGNLDYIKIPHHASPTGDALVRKLRNMNVIASSVATTTVYRNHRLPNPYVVETYKKWDSELKVFSSGHSNKEDDLDRIGVIRTEFDILLKDPVPITVSLEGNAVELL